MFPWFNRAIDSLERLIFEMTYYVSSSMLNSANSLTHSLTILGFYLMANFQWSAQFTQGLKEFSRKLQTLQFADK